MKEINFYRVFLLAPIVIPCISLVLYTNGVNSIILSLLSLSLIMGGIPYLFLLAFLFWASFRRTIVSFKFLLKISPFIFSFYLFPVLLLINYLAINKPLPATSETSAPFYMWIFMSGHILMVGYSYILLAFCLARLGLKFGWIKPSSTAGFKQ
ncbi:MAG: hypothetical protein QS721_05995 [Candidatus Endonucleobacter sp. (ex Gigantidas childressi)]|nr:hypothetical protein [Candidatus Endonucleobacter sp. (ex Gigantidas childressi)]